MKKHINCSKFIVSVLLIVITLFTSSVSFAAWWATPGYEWALTKRLTTVKTTNQLKQNVIHGDLYSTIIAYLEMKGVDPEGRLVHHNDDMYGLNNVVAGLFKIINTYISKSSLTPDEYRIVESYVDHGRKTFNQYSSYLTRDNIKNVDLYLRLAQYRAALLINDRDFRELVLSRLGNVKNSEIITYGIIPYAGEISRREFLLLMHDLLSTQNISDDEVIRNFNDAGVLLGYQSDLMLDKELTYSEMLTFLYRFEIYDFNPTVEDEEIIEE